MLNEIAGWISILTGVLMGLYMGWKFQSDTWLGGYGSLSRRMVRLAHVALVALGMLNILLAGTLEDVVLPTMLARTASWAMIAGAVLMPACCISIAFGWRRFEIFAAPVLCLLTAVILTIGGLVR